MSSAARRILIYWLLLLAPTLAVGVGAIQLLRREQSRLAAQEAYAGEARRAAVAARAGLIAENVELITGDIQTGLLETLASLPGAGLEAELVLWEKSNPLVRTAFRCRLDGRILWPGAAASDEASRGFRRRFAPLLENNPPWIARVSPAAPTAAKALAEAAAPSPTAAETSKEEKMLRQQTASNVFKVQSARREAQGTAKVRSSVSRDAAAETEMSALADKKSTLDEAVFSGRQGWTPWLTDGRLYLLGWIESPATGEVRGVEVKLAELISRLAGALPAETNPGEGYALRDERGRIMHQAGLIPRELSPPITRLPVAAGVLPGWEIVAFLEAPSYSSTPATGTGFFLIGSILVGILIVAILAGGLLLLRQARQSEAEARQKTSFVGNVSHEFKTPLTTIRLYAELLEQGRVPDEAKRVDYLRTIGRETQRLARLVGNALDFSRLEQGQKKFERAALELNEALTRLLDTQEPRLHEAGLALRRDLSRAAVKVATDRDAFEQIMLNLLDNAAKYAAAGGEVLVTLIPLAGQGAEIRVSDRGPGVPPEHRARIFDKFHRVDTALTAEKTGTGLGLSIARQLARGLGGELRFEPRPGGGATFVLTLP